MSAAFVLQWRAMPTVVIEARKEMASLSSLRAVPKEYLSVFSST